MSFRIYRLARKEKRRVNLRKGLCANNYTGRKGKGPSGTGCRNEEKGPGKPFSRAAS